MEEKVKIINNVSHGHFRLEDGDSRTLVVTKELRYRWRFGADGSVLEITDLRTGQNAKLLG